MTIERINPKDLPEPQGYSQVVRAAPGTTLYISGQGAYTADHQLVGPKDHYAQTKQALTNVLAALRSSGATFSNVVRATYLVVDLSPDALEGFSRAVAEVLGPDAEQPAATMIGVQALGYPEMLVEIEVTAVV
ncbi:MAG TPA: Rid family hydrolase [Acidimicrobiia bacterium]|nr:Rid family hydrolase [Acidimicrobiia bacterium]